MNSVLKSILMQKKHIFAHERIAKTSSSQKYTHIEYISRGCCANTKLKENRKKYGNGFYRKITEKSNVKISYAEIKRKKNGIFSGMRTNKRVFLYKAVHSEYMANCAIPPINARITR